MITGIILASGFSTRMGEDKLLLEIDGESIIEKVIRAAKKSSLDRLILVYRKEQVGLIGKKYGVKSIYNEKADLGQSQSMKLGIIEAGKTDAYMFIVGDQVFLTAQLINKLIEEYEVCKSTIVIPYFNGKRNMPMIMSSLYKDELLNVVGDKGGRDIVRDNSDQVKQINIEDAKLGIDLDTPEDLIEILNKS